MILDLEKILGFAISQIDFTGISPTDTVSYSWGNKIELNQWIVMKDKEISGKRAFKIDNTAKYPLIWLTHPIEGEDMGFENHFKDIRVIIATNTNAEWLNTTRESETMPFLTNIANAFIAGIQRNKNITLDRGDNGTAEVWFKKIYNYQEEYSESYKSSDNTNATLDPWDAVILKFSLRINNNCLKEIQLCQ